MKLGKALATGVAQERPEDHAVHEEFHEPRDAQDRHEVQDLQASVPDEVPAAR